MIDYYELLQISPQADSETVHRVYRYLAARVHPDNPESGDAESFRVAKEGFDVLSNPTRRAEYDAARRREAGEVAPLSMGFPRDYLDFTTWYLVKKGYITRADNSDFALTSDGVDLVETQRMNLPVLNKLMTNGKTPSANDQRAALASSNNGNIPIILYANMSNLTDRRINGRGRRATDQHHL